MGLWSRIFSRRIVVAASESDLDELRKRLQRLEIRQGEQQLSLEAIDEAVYRLSKRQAGRAGGRPPATPSLDSVDQSDKAALRQHFAGELAARARGNIPRE